MTDNPTKETLLTFPCDFTFKIFGLANQEFENEAFSIVHKHAPNLSDRAINAKPSDKGKYLALTITVHVESKEQLDNIYRELSASPHILMVL